MMAMYITIYKMQHLEYRILGEYIATFSGLLRSDNHIPNYVLFQRRAEREHLFAHASSLVVFDALLSSGYWPPVSGNLKAINSRPLQDQIATQKIRRQIRNAMSTVQVITMVIIGLPSAAVFKDFDLLITIA
jgi:hypothetical protein